jgi:hypothetical protein
MEIINLTQKESVNLRLGDVVVVTEENLVEGTDDLYYYMIVQCGDEFCAFSLDLFRVMMSSAADSPEDVLEYFEGENITIVPREKLSLTLN